MSRAHVMAIVIVLCIFAGCEAGKRDIVVVDKTLRNVPNASSAGSPELGVSVPTTSWIYWVEGSVSNHGTEEAKNIEISFTVTDGSERFVLTADVPVVPAGGRVMYRSDQKVSSRILSFVDAEPEIRAPR